MKVDKLHQLIKSLTKSEKRYFRLFSKRSGDKNPKNYLFLFEALEKLETYHEGILCEDLNAKGVNTKYLSADKNYLYTSILDALRTYNATYSAKQQVRRYLDFADIVSEKGLSHQAVKYLKKAKIIATENDAVQYLPEILQVERKLLSAHYDAKQLEKSHKQMREGLEALENLYEYEFYNRRCNLLRIRFGKTNDPNKLEELQTLLDNTNYETASPSSFAAQKWFLMAEAIRFYIINDIHSEFKANQELLQLMNQTTGFVKNNPLEYSSVFSRILILSKRVAPDNYPNLLQQFLAFAETVNKENKKVKARVYTLAYSTEMVRIIQSGVFEEGLELMPVVIKLMKDYSEVINPAFCLNNYYKFAYMFIGVDNYSMALEQLDYLFDNYSIKQRPDIYCYAKLLTCICHYELGNITLLPHLADSAKYYFQKEKRLGKAENIFLKFIKNIGKAENKKTNFSSLLSQLEQELPKEKGQDYFDFIRWTKAKIEGSNFSNLSPTLPFG